MRVGVEKNPQKSIGFSRKMGIELGKPYMVKKAFSGGTLILTKIDGKEFSNHINAYVVKKYYA